MKFKVGDKVKLKNSEFNSYLQGNNKSGTLFYMVKFGKDFVYTISSIENFGDFIKFIEYPEGCFSSRVEGISEINEAKLRNMLK